MHSALVGWSRHSICIRHNCFVHTVECCITHVPIDQLLDHDLCLPSAHCKHTNTHREFYEPKIVHCIAHCDCAQFPTPVHRRDRTRERKTEKPKVSMWMRIEFNVRRAWVARGSWTHSVGGAYKQHERRTSRWTSRCASSVVSILKTNTLGHLLERRHNKTTYLSCVSQSLKLKNSKFCSSKFCMRNVVKCVSNNFSTIVESHCSS